MAENIIVHLTIQTVVHTLVFVLVYKVNKKKKGIAPKFKL